MSALVVLAVDDEPRALADVQRLLERSPRVERVDTAGGGREALSRLVSGHYDALLLDVRMPEIEGLELARLLRRFDDPPEVVFLTGHAEAAVEAFEVEAMDFLVKPVSRERLDAALARIEAARARSGTGSAQASGATGVVALDNPGAEGKRLVRLDRISRIDADGDYAQIHSEDGDFVLRASLAQLEEDWGGAGFARVHRAHLVNLNHAIELRSQPNGTAVIELRDGSRVPVARRSVAALRRRLKG